MGEHIIIAGIAAKDQSTLKKIMEGNGLRKDNTIAFLTVKEKDPIYKDSVIEAMLSALANTVSKKLPNAIRVIYIPYKGSDILVEKLFPFADIQSLDNTRTYVDYILTHFDHINNLGQQLLGMIRNGLNIKARPSRRHYILLPNKNFIIDNLCFSTLLREFYFGNRDENVFHCIKENKKLHCYEDSRNIAFPVTKMNEGNLRFEQSSMSPRHFLTGLYRLGMLWDAGFHFDVKHSSKPTLSGFKFICSLKGEVEYSEATHLNIYLNDFVRVPQK